MRLLAFALGLALLASPSLAGPLDLPQGSFRMAAASSCSAWKAICDARGPGCGKKFTACLRSGCWTEAAKFGGKKHCGLAKN